MSNEKSALRITELDYNSIRDNLKLFLQDQEEFSDFNFDGSGLSVLLNLLAFNSHYLAYYGNMIGNEMFLDTAQLRNSILSHAKSICYVPESKKGALAKVNILATPSESEDSSPTSITLEKYTRLLGSDLDGINYPFVTLYSNTITKSGDTFSFNNINIKQGEVITLQYGVSGDRKYEIPSANVDTDTISITIQESTSNTDTKRYSLAEDITEITAESLVYFIEENERGNYTFYFGDNVLGKSPKTGNIIICTYLDTVGTAANGIGKFTFVQPIANTYRDNVRVSVVTSSYGGIEKETEKQIQFRAPYAYTTQNRGVTTYDYESILLKEFNNIDAISVWGGEDNDPPVYGKVYFSIKTNDNYYLTEFEKDQIKNSLVKKVNVLTITPEIVDPEYIYLVISAKVYYNAKLTSRTSDEIDALVRAAIQDYNEVELKTFRSTFRKSKLQQYIENCEKSITGSDLTIYAQSRILLAPGVKDSYISRFNMPISKGEFGKKLSTFPEVIVRDLNNNLRPVFFEEIPESLTGISAVSVVNPGRNFQAIPTVTITGDGSGATAKAHIINQKVNNIEIINPGSNYTRATVIISGGGGSEATAIAKVDNNYGKLRSYYYLNTGEKVIVNGDAGTVDYLNGEIILKELTPIEVTENEYYDNNILALNTLPSNQVIGPVRNRILSIDISNPASIVTEIIAE